ncbi:hypothetical protein THASP1DRAFT_29722 [Thamnocephalis sphaerospora]|uniref:Uncharacterized protein n=1 Tax=Thamnocephalis sphaerospora TaxID=78915 RepID=A0A4P9XQZ1_9FUNG|nr:hypothetical protein THASP1DRAFT_29722 [Thamnocephalis sphaerospora]|eukprot:RKP08476.1 hypothetical protein THASP1DRAFT_29722 [Thamnocephalis sphaerospora]
MPPPLAPRLPLPQGATALARAHPQPNVQPLPAQSRKRPREEDEPSVLTSFTNMLSRAHSNASREFDELCSYLSGVFGTRLSTFLADESVMEPRKEKVVASRKPPIETKPNVAKMMLAQRMRNPLGPAPHGGIAKRGQRSTLTNVTKSPKLLRQVVAKQEEQEDQGLSAAEKRTFTDLSQQYAARHNQTLAAAVQGRKQRHEKPAAAVKAPASPNTVRRVPIAKDPFAETKRDTSIFKTSGPIKPPASLLRPTARKSALHIVGMSTLRLATGETPRKPIRRLHKTSDAGATPVKRNSASVFAGLSPATTSKPTIPPSTVQRAPRIAAIAEQALLRTAGRTPAHKRVRIVAASDATPSAKGCDAPLDDRYFVPAVNTPDAVDASEIEHWLLDDASKAHAAPFKPEAPTPSNTLLSNVTRTTPQRRASAVAKDRVHDLYESVRRVKLSNSIAAHHARQAYIEASAASKEKSASNSVARTRTGERDTHPQQTSAEHARRPAAPDAQRRVDDCYYCYCYCYYYYYYYYYYCCCCCCYKTTNCCGVTPPCPGRIHTGRI